MSIILTHQDFNVYSHIAKWTSASGMSLSILGALVIIALVNSAATNLNTEQNLHWQQVSNLLTHHKSSIIAGKQIDTIRNLNKV